MILKIFSRISLARSDTSVPSAMLAFEVTMGGDFAVTKRTKNMFSSVVSNLITFSRSCINELFCTEATASYLSKPK